ncbi:MAG: amidohydrolase family protein, partial [bacterium]|nr:amidohydrolase family protein [bacterium]
MDRNYPVVDSHTHLQRIPGHMWDSPPERTLKLMNKAGIAVSIVMTYGDASPENREPLEYIEHCVARFPHRLIGYARINPMLGRPSEDLLEYAVRHMNMKALKLHPMGYQGSPDSSETVAIMRLAGRLNVPVLFHCGDEELTLPLQIERGASQCPETSIILGHMGGYFHVDDAIAAAVRNPNIYLETSGMP